MRKISLRCSLTTLAAVSALALTAGCGGSADGPADAKDSTAGQKSAPAPPLTQAQLDKALLSAAETDGYESQANKSTDLRPKADKDQCRPLADMTASGAAARTPAAEGFASRSFGSKQAPGLAVTVSLLSYKGDAAQQTLADLRDAIAACGDGFSTSGNNGGATVKYVEIKKETSPKGGDESVSWLMTGSAQGQKVPMRMTATRSGNSLAVFFTLHLTDSSGGKLPAEIHSAQIEKLEKATDAA